MSTPAQRAAERIKAKALEQKRVTTHREVEPPYIYGLTYEQRRAVQRGAKYSRAFHYVQRSRL